MDLLEPVSKKCRTFFSPSGGRKYHLRSRANFGEDKLAQTQATPVLSCSTSTSGLTTFVMIWFRLLLLQEHSPQSHTYMGDVRRSVDRNSTKTVGSLVGLIRDYFKSRSDLESWGEDVDYIKFTVHRVRQYLTLIESPPNVCPRTQQGQNGKKGNW